MPPPPAAQAVSGLTYTLLRGKFGATYPSHAGPPAGPKVVERGTLSRLGTGYHCDPLAPPGSPATTTCLSSKYKTQLALRATGVLRVTAADAKGAGVRLLLMATGSARVTVNGSVVGDLTIAGG